MKKYPMKLVPHIRTALWGREIWVASGMEALPCEIANGEYAGKTVPELMAEFPAELAGAKYAGAKRFPLLLKVIETEDRLSLQVHPNGNTAKICGGDPKTEMWYVFGGKPGAYIFAGMKPEADEGMLVKAMENGTAETLLEKFDAAPGGALFIPGGLVHAIGGGCRLFEVQQASDTTWRLHDWNRIDRTTGQPRKTHLREGLASIDWSLPPPEMKFAGDSGELSTLVECPYFRFSVLETGSECSLPESDGARIAYCADGACSISAGEEEGLPVLSGECVLIPANTGFSAVPSGGKCRILVSEVL